MTLDEIIRRTAARKAAGADQRYPHHAGKAKAVPPRKRGRAAPAPLPVLACVHEGVVVAPCGGCGGSEARHVRDCEVHGTATREEAGKDVGMVCARCPDRRLYPPVAARHLLYHAYPLASAAPVWKAGLSRLRDRWDVFTGRKLVAVMTGPDLAPPSEVAAELPADAELLPLPNDPRLREVVSWMPLWDAVLATAADADAVLYAHAKGVTRPDGVCRRWAEAMYAAALDRTEAVWEQLKTRPIAGAFKKVGRAFPGSKSAWHYSGAFFWARAGDFKNRPWRKAELQWWGTESWPGTAYSPEEAGCVFHEGGLEMDLYSPEYWAAFVKGVP